MLAMLSVSCLAAALSGPPREIYFDTIEGLGYCIFGKCLFPLVEVVTMFYWLRKRLAIMNSEQKAETLKPDANHSINNNSRIGFPYQFKHR
jgi:hypothetical protein